MSTEQTAPGTANGPLDWYRTLDGRGRKAFVGAFGGYGLDSYDYQVLPLALSAIAAYFSLSSGQAGLLGTVTLVVSALGGALAGILADRIGRVRTLQLTVATYTVFTVLCGFAPNYETLLVFRALQGLGFGGEWAAGAILVAEYAKPEYRGRAVAFVQSAWAVGWGLAAIVATVAFSTLHPDLAWRALFWTGVIPALLVIWVRRYVTDADGVTERRTQTAQRGSFRAIFSGRLRWTTCFAALLAIGVQGGYYTLATWLPLYLKETRGLDVLGTGGYLALVISGAFVGYVCGASLTDALGRKLTFVTFAAASACLLLAFSLVPLASNNVIMLLCFPLGFAISAIFSGFGSYLAELYPTALRGTGQGFTYNFGRGLGALFPGIVGFLADSWGLGGAMAFGAFGYVLAVLALFGLPETKGRIILSQPDAPTAEGTRR